MCGIIGYQGKRDAFEVLIKGLTTLEYRGYDSSGISVIKDNAFARVRSKGKLDNLVNKTKGKDLTSNIGIGHTRWATHGIVSEPNSHPHQIGNVSIVHNGIIENYIQLKEELKKNHKNITLLSETDSELIAALIYINIKRGLLNAVLEIIPKLHGAYSVVAISEDEPRKLVGFKNGPPLVVGKGSGETIIASDINPIVPYTKDVLYLKDNEIIEVIGDQYKLLDISGREKFPKFITVNWEVKEEGKKGFSHYMLKEIYDQPNSIKQAILPFIDIDNKTINLPNLGFGQKFIDFVNSNNEACDNTHKVLEKVEHIFIVSCGTSYHAGLVGKYLIENWVNVKVEVDMSSEFRYRNPLIPKNSLFISISQSGETADSIEALRLAKKFGAQTLSISNTPGSTLDRESGGHIYMSAGQEIGVASTKAFTCSLTGLTALAFCMSKLKNKNILKEPDIFNSLITLPTQIETVLGLDKTVQKIAKELKDSKFLFIGRGISYPIALEGALKLKELAYIHAEGYAAGEMKHGPIALIDTKMIIVAIAPSDHVYEKTINNLEEARARGANIISITDSNNKHLDRLSLHRIVIPKNILSGILSVIPLQLLAFHIANALGHNADRPRNLAKSVTVE